MSTKFLAPALAVVLGIVVSGCATSSHLQRLQPGEERVIEHYPGESKVPGWVKDPVLEKKGRLFFKGQASGAPELDLCLRQAKANAIQNMVEAVKVRARSEYSEALRGTPAPGSQISRYLESMIAWTTENIELSGLTPEDEYWTKIAVRTYGGLEHKYQCYVRLSLPLEGFEAARNAALQQSIASADSDAERALLEEMRQKLSRD